MTFTNKVEQPAKHGRRHQGMSKRTLEHIASCFGEPQQTVLHGNKKSGMVAFMDEASVAAALEAAKHGQIVEVEPLEEDEDEGPSSTSTNDATGLRGWVNAHKAKRPGNAELQRQLDTWVAEHEEEEARAERAQQAAMAEDGWTVVVRSKGRKRTKDSETGAIQSGGMAAAAARAMAQGSKGAPLEDFYRFQQREKRRNELVDLRIKFEEDRHRIQSLRASRNFKPF
ncbi:ribosomal RNA-processing protein 7-domain-containing protein [Dunaliella salina]|uniref:Ribosomal RNA-processing protein 7-domain-containing protein n=1 Tax=Dunaliella salina TaxID=3046 RepID=A0ABQ7G9V7_DUNSA|nr:ribosomal RNA-processing protein 7-domain-containing protein [Dunaliella salina]|eukprot:KAF5831389.1 ribosomal RNA-processing protein 7-domain-containing protein [Dunaliella salina]